MPGLIRNVAALLLGYGMMRMGNSLLGIVIPLDMQAAGLSTTATGAVMTTFFFGLMLGALWSRKIITGVGHIRAFAGFAALTSASMLVYPAVPVLPAWPVLRFVEGFCVAGLVSIIESWLNEQCTNANRGRVLGIYMLSTYAAAVGGQLLVNLPEIGGAAPYIMAAFLLTLSLVPVVLTRIEAPSLEFVASLSLVEIFAFSPLGVIGAIVAGMLTGAYYGMGAVLADQFGLTLWQVSLFMASVIGGGIVFQWPIGKLSDSYDRRSVLIGVLVSVTAVSAVMGFTFGSGLGMARILLLAGLFGGGVITIYPVVVAHAFDHVRPGRYVALAGGLLLFYSAGAALGPLLSAFAMSQAGPVGFFMFTGGIAGVSAAYTAYRMLRRAPVVVGEPAEFVAVPPTTPVVAEMDPRAPAPVPRK